MNLCFSIPNVHIIFVTHYFRHYVFYQKGEWLYMIKVCFYLYNAKGKKAVQQNTLTGQAHPHGTHQVKNFLCPVSGILNDLFYE